MAVITITEENHKKEVEESTKPIIVDVYAPWCGPCQHMMPVIEELEKELGDKYKFVKINVDNAGELARKVGIQGVPTFLIMKKGKEVNR